MAAASFKDFSCRAGRAHVGMPASRWNEILEDTQDAPQFIGMRSHWLCKEAVLPYDVQAACTRDIHTSHSASVSREGFEKGMGHSVISRRAVASYMVTEALRSSCLA